MTMSKYKLTFSLASLVLIFALAFVTMPALAADGGPTVTITDAGTADTASTRSAFLLKFTFSHSVTDFTDSGDATFQLYDKDGVLIGTAAPIVPAAVTGNPREYTASIDVSSATGDPIGFRVTVDADQATGNTRDNSLGNQATFKDFDLPPLLTVGSLVLSAAKADPQNPATDGDDYVLTLTYKDAADAAAAPSPAPLVANLTFAPAYLQTAVVAGNTIAENTDTTDLGDYTLNIVHPTGAPAVTIGVQPSYIKGVTSVRVPPAVTATQNPPEAMIAVTGHDATERTYRISVTFTPAADSLGNAGAAIKGFDSTKLDIKDSSTPAADVITTAEAERKADNSYVAILKYDRLSVPPLTVKVKQSAQKTSNPDHSAMVGEAAPEPPEVTQGDPSVAIMTSDHDATARTFRVQVTITPGMKSDGTAGDPVTAFGLSDLKITDAGDADATITAVDQRFTAGTTAGSASMYVAILMYNPLAVLPLTVTTADDFMTSDDPVISAMVPSADDPDPDPAVPAAPMNVMATADQTAKTITVTWDAVDGADSYTVTKHYMADGVAMTKVLPDADNTDTTITIPPAGEPALAQGVAFTFSVTATNAAGTSAASAMSNSVMIDAPPANNAPAFAAGTSIANIMARETMAITPVTLPSATDADGDTITYTLTPDLPAGLMLRGTVISGTPTAAMAATQYTWTASDGMDSAYLMFSITVAVDHAPTFGDQTIDNVTATVGKATASILPSATDADGDAIRYSLSPAPPAGITFNATTQVLSGTPRAVMAPTAYTYTAMAGTKSAMLRFIIEVAAAPTTPEPPQPANNPPAFPVGAAIANIHAMVGTAITPQILPVATDPDGDNVSHTLTPIPPSWLTYRTGVLSGTPTTAMSPTGYRYVASDGKGGIAVLSFLVEVAAAPPVTPAIVLPAGIPDIGSGFASGTGRVVGTTTLSGSIAADSFGVVLADDLPDLEDFFRQKGTIILDDGADAKKRSVLISEILWGLDAGEPAGMQDRRQFIELYNTSNSASVNVTGWTLTFTLHRPAPNEDVDRVSNAGTIVDAGWVMDIGQSGVLTGTTLAGVSALGGQGVPVDIISAYRNINYNATQSSQDLKDDHTRAGHKKGSWKASSRITTQVGIKASPGARHFIELGPLTKSGVSRTPFIINEIGNATGGANDWIELRNVTDSEASLKNYQLSVVTSDKKDNLLFHFHDQDYKVPAKGILLIPSTDPSGNDLAGGDNVAKGQLDEVLEGASHRYIVPTKGITRAADGGSFTLPDSGKTLLILRNNHESKHLGTGNQIVDVIGTLSIQDASRGTALWPLSVWGGPHGNVVKNGDEDFRAGKVYQRNNTNADGKEAIEIRGYTGVGYDRFAAANGENGGTPGYDNGALKHKYSDFSGQIAISEIMLATEENADAGRVPRATRLPQWIELYNNSMTQAVTISNWHLEIQNDDTEGFQGNLHGTLRLKGIHIQPNQTVIIVSNSGLNSGNFPAQRLINVFLDGTYRRELGLVSRGDQILNPAGFYIELRDHENRPVDEIGNLGVSRRTGTGRRDNFGEAWEMPSLHSEEGHRTSLIRVYNDSMAENGLMPESWRRASDTNFRNVPSLTYFGNHRDFGTPGYRGGGPLPVQLSKFRPERLDSGEVVIRWVTESELNNAGFNILRTEDRDGVYTQVNTELIAGHGTTSERNSYEWKDTTAKPNVVYYYQIQDVSLDGQVQTLRISRLKGTVSAEGKITTTWGGLKSQD